MTEPLISVSKLSKSYQRGGETLRVLDGLDLQVPAGDFCALMGPSGSGKSTLLNILGGLDHADEGSVVIGGEEITGLDGDELARWRAETVGFVFQGFNLIPVLTAFENVELPLLLAPLNRRQRREHAMHALDLVGLSDRAGHRPSQLSGGQEQRVAIARAVVTDPTLILADEPTGDLDRASADQVISLLCRLNEELHKTIVLVTHDSVVAQRTKRIVRLDKGRLVGADVAEVTTGRGTTT